MKKLISYFFQGLLYVVPISVTVYVLYLAVSKADYIISSIPGFKWAADIPGLGLILILALVTLCGYLGLRIIKTPIARLVNSIFTSVPIVRMIYTSMRDLMNAFVGEKRKFNRPVLVSLDNEGINHRLGFITAESLESMNIKGMVAVYSPYPYSIMGDLIIVPADHVTPIDADPAEFMKFVVSGGVS